MADEVSLAVVGDGSTGKSTIINKFKANGFAAVYKQTVGIDFYEKKVKIREKLVSLSVRDIGGQSINSQNLQKYLANIDIIFVNYDVTNHNSFANVDDWLVKTKTFCFETAKIYLIGNKIDLIAQREVTENEHNAYVIDNGLAGGFFMSAKTGENLIKAFYQVAADRKGITLSSYELGALDTVITAHIVLSGDNGRTTFADEIEREDREAEERKKRKKTTQALCLIS